MSIPSVSPMARPVAPSRISVGGKMTRGNRRVHRVRGPTDCPVRTESSRPFSRVSPPPNRGVKKTSLTRRIVPLERLRKHSTPIIGVCQVKSFFTTYSGVNPALRQSMALALSAGRMRHSAAVLSITRHHNSSQYRTRHQQNSLKQTVRSTPLALTSFLQRFGALSLATHSAGNSLGKHASFFNRTHSGPSGLALTTVGAGSVNVAIGFSPSTSTVATGPTETVVDITRAVLTATIAAIMPHLPQILTTSSPSVRARGGRGSRLSHAASSALWPRVHSSCRQCP